MPALKDLRTSGGRLANGDNEVLDRDRHAGKGVQFLGSGTAGSAGSVDVGGNGQSLFAVNVQERINLTVDVGNAVEVRLRHLDGGNFAGGQLGCEVGSGVADEFVLQLSHSD
ncbi:hypothetical protein PJL18_03750 [Paenarthrobacter nicotinovorans]|nr:hypothetical protein [Paenarthrobacter nicotinovorans]